MILTRKQKEWLYATVFEHPMFNDGTHDRKMLKQVWRMDLSDTDEDFPYCLSIDGEPYDYFIEDFVNRLREVR